MNSVFRYFQIIGLLLREILTKPGWAYHHILGYVDQRLLLRFHQKRRCENSQYASSLNNIISRLRRDNSPLAMRSENRSGAPLAEIRTAAISSTNDASEELQQLVSALTLELKPEIVVEVGVGRGATTRTILQAMQDNRKGHLYSIEFPSLRWNYAAQVGALVPDDLHDRWTLVWGPSQSRLPELFKQIGPVNLFIHDGAHSYHIQKADLTYAARNLRASGVLVSDDINNDSFLEVGQGYGLATYLIEQSKGDPIGVAFVTDDGMK